MPYEGVYFVWCGQKMPPTLGGSRILQHPLDIKLHTHHAKQRQGWLSHIVYPTGSACSYDIALYWLTGSGREGCQRQRNHPAFEPKSVKACKHGSPLITNHHKAVNCVHSFDKHLVMSFEILLQNLWLSPPALSGQQSTSTIPVIHSHTWEYSLVGNRACTSYR